VLALAAEDGRQIKAVVMIDRGVDLGRTVKQFRTALLELGIEPKTQARRPHRNSAIHALERLCCYRLGALPPAERDVLADTVKHLKKGLYRSKLGRARKKILKDFDTRHYTLTIT
jgi:hypothetical protein